MFVIETHKVSNKRIALTERKSARANGWAAGSYCVVMPLKHQGFSGSMSTGTGFLLKKGSGSSLGALDIFVDSRGFGDAVVWTDFRGLC